MHLCDSLDGLYWLILFHGWEKPRIWEKPHILDYMRTYYPASVLLQTPKWMFDGGNGSDLSAGVRFDQENGVTDRETCAIKAR